MLSLDRQSVLTALILVVVGLSTMHAQASAEPIEVTVCGKVTRFSPASSSANGTLVIGGDRFDVTADTVIEDVIDIGHPACVRLTFDATGAIARVSGTAKKADPDLREGSDQERAANGDSTSVVKAKQPQRDAVIGESGTSPRVAHEPSSSGVGALPVTGGSAPSGPLYGIVSLAAVLLAGFGVFSARRGI